MKRLFLTLIACAYCVVGTAQSGYRLQYWFDGHYESHVTDTISDSTWHSFIDVSSIDMGLHTLHLHVRDTAGRWSVPHSVLFYNVSQDTSFTYTYWFDQNIGDKHVGNVGNGHLLLDVGGLSDGFHTLNMRVGNSVSSTENSYMFFKEPVQQFPLSYTCWFDNDYDNRTTDSIGNGHIVLNTESLDPGIHTVRVMIGNGAAATVQSYIFYNTPPEDSIYTYTYWFDQNIGDKHVGNVGNGHLLLDVGGLSDGFHTLNMRVGNSVFFTENSYMFFKEPVQQFPLSYTCWFDNDYDNHTTDSIGNGHIVLNTGTLESGIHTVRVMIGSGTAATVQSYIFYRTPPDDSLYTITYWFDQNIGDKHVGNVGNGHLLLDVGGLSDGFHTLNMRVGNSVSSTENSYMFFIDAGLIKKYEYWFNGMDSLKKVVNLSPMKDTLKILSLLPVDTLPIRSTCFHYEPNNGNPIIYAENNISFRFWTSNKRYIDRTFQYIDYNVSDTVIADTLERDTTKRISSLTNNKIHWFKLAAGRGDSLSFRTDRRCTMQLYSPSGTMMFHASADSVLAWDGCHAMENGVYYLAVHDAEDTGTIAVSYQWIYKYAVLAWDVHRVGNGGVSSIIFQGNGFNNLDTVYLVKGRDTLPALYIGHESNTTTSIFFNFENADTGVYNGVFVYKDETLYKNHIIAVETAVPIVLVSNVSYPSTFLRGSKVTYLLTISNMGNMTAYYVPIHAYIKSSTNGISQIVYEGIDFPSISETINLDSFSEPNKKEIIEWFAAQGDDRHFERMKVIDSLSKDTVLIRSNYVFITIAPYETKTYSLIITTIDSVDVWFNVSDVINPFRISSRNLSSTERKMDQQRAADPWRCILDIMICFSNMRSAELSVTSLICNMIPGVDLPVDILLGLSSCINDAFQVGLNSLYQTLYGNDDVTKLKHSTLTINTLTNIVTDCGSSALRQVVPFAKVIPFVKKISNYADFFNIGTLGVFGELPEFYVPPGGPGSDMINCGITMFKKKDYCCVFDCGGGGGKTTPVKPVDPNEITGYIAESGSLAVGVEMEQLYYTIEFENDTNFATAHANTVVVRDTLDGNVFDLNSFSSTAFSIGKDITNINGLQGFTRTVDMRPAINTLAQVELNYTIDSGFAVATWTFSSLDPMTLQPVTVDSLGFLRVGGTGEVDFLIRRKANLPDSTLINNRAYIVFDNEAPIATSIWRNIVDNTPPVSIIDSVIYSDVANVHISAKDNLSGVWRYNVYGQDSVWHKLAENIPIDSVVELDTFINQYSVLRAIAIDSAGNMELLPVAPDTTTYHVLLLVDTTQGYVAGGGRFRLLDTAIISATAKHGFHFSHWNDGDTNNPRLVTVAQDTSFTALFDCIPLHASDSITVCNSYSWHGKVYTASTELTDTLTAINGCDSIVTHHVVIHHPIHVSKTDTACETYTWNGKVYTTSGDYTYKHLDGNGCTQVDTLHLTIHNPVHVAKTDTACESYTWNGKVYSTSGDYTYKHLDGNGCTQVDTLHLTIYNPVHVAKTDTACETYTWNGKVYTTSGDYTYKHLDANGCTQVDTLHLTVNHPIHVAKTDTACETYTWNGKVYATSGDYTYKHLDANGCTQVDTLHLTIHNPVHVAKTDTACETYTWNGKAYTTSGDYTYSHLDSNGCAQVDTLHLTVNHPIHVAKTDTACETYTWNGKVYTASGDYTYKHLDANGCTQVDTLHLTVNHPVHVAKTDTACETYTWNGKVYTTSGDYTYKHLDANGCTQVDTLHLIVRHPLHKAFTDTACMQYIWNGKLFTASGDYTYKHLDANGCTQVDTLHLTVNHPAHIAKTDTACETYTWNGKVYTTSGNYTYKHLDANGCTQVDTLYLTVNHPVYVAKTDTACETYTWNGKAYTVSGDYTYKHLDANGCTQVDTLHLTVHYNSVRNDTVEVCDRYTWHDSNYTESGIHQWHGFTVAGCDSTITLHLTINYSADTTITDTADNSYTWHDSVYTESGTYQWKGSTIAGCDSTVTLMLVIRHVGIEVIDGNGKKVRVYPNPTDGWLTIDADNILSIEVYDNTGRRVAEYGATNRIDLSHLPMGGYILKIRMEKGSSIHHVIRN